MVCTHQMYNHSYVCKEMSELNLRLLHILSDKQSFMPLLLILN